MHVTPETEPTSLHVDDVIREEHHETTGAQPRAFPTLLKRMQTTSVAGDRLHSEDGNEEKVAPRVPNLSPVIFWHWRVFTELEGCNSFVPRDVLT